MSTITQLHGEALPGRAFGLQAGGQIPPAGQDEFGKYLPSDAHGQDGQDRGLSGPDIGAAVMMPSDVWPESARGPDSSIPTPMPSDVWPESTRGPDSSSAPTPMPSDVWPESARGPDSSAPVSMPSDVGAESARGPDSADQVSTPSDVAAGFDVLHSLPVDASGRLQLAEAARRYAIGSLLDQLGREAGGRVL